MKQESLSFVAFQNVSTTPEKKKGNGTIVFIDTLTRVIYILYMENLFLIPLVLILTTHF